MSIPTPASTPTPTSPTPTRTSPTVSSATPVSGHGIRGVCPECDGPVRFDRAPLAGQVARCGDCGVELEVTATSPLTLALAPEVEEDWGE